MPIPLRNAPLAAACVLALAAGPVSAAPVQDLFVVTTGSGSLTRAPGGYSLTLASPHAEVVRFTDRPARRADALPLGEFVSGWRAFGFAADPPNAALVVSGAPASRDTMILELTRPRRTGARLVFRARPVGPTSRALAAFATRADRHRPMRFGRASLFVDGAPGVADTVFRPVTLTFSNAMPGQDLRVIVQPAGAGTVAWSTGPSFQSTSGLAINAQSGSVPVL